MNVKRKLIAALAALALLAAGCTTFTNPATGGRHLLMVGAETERGWGQQVHTELQKKPGFLQDAAKKERVERVGRKVVAASDDRNWDYKFEVLDTKTPNAFAAPGGFIFVTDGLLDMVAGDDELAAVLAHEAGHIAAKHTALRMQRAMLMQGLAVGLAVSSGEENAETTAQLAMAVSAFILLSHSREMEHQADKLGVRYAHRAGYNPEGMVSFFTKLEKMEAQKGGGGQMPNFLSTHPSTPDRIDRVKEHIRQVRAGTSP